MRGRKGVAIVRLVSPNSPVGADACVGFATKGDAASGKVACAQIVVLRELSPQPTRLLQCRNRHRSPWNRHGRGVAALVVWIRDGAHEEHQPLVPLPQLFAGDLALGVASCHGAVSVAGGSVARLRDQAATQRRMTSPLRRRACPFSIIRNASGARLRDGGRHAVSCTRLTASWKLRPYSRKDPSASRSRATRVAFARRARSVAGRVSGIISGRSPPVIGPAPMRALVFGS